MQATCPHCQTVFKVSDENLRAADGYVRCGICKEVFNALEKSWQNSKKEPATKTKIEPTITAKVADTSKPAVKKDTPTNHTASVEPISGQTAANSQNVSDKKKNQLDMLAKPSETSKPEPKPAIDKSSNTKPVAPVIKTPTAEIKAKPPEKTASSAKPNGTPGVRANNLFDGVQSKLIPDEFRIPELHNTYSLWRDLAWSLAILVLTASLFVEYTWFNRNELIRNPQLRPLVTQFCTIANCNTMELREPGEIEMTTRNIYTHPNVKNALMISGTLINHAPFEQPYPNILIDFSDVRGEVIASRIFTPEDYLQIKASRLKPLAPQASVDFNMEIQDPGKNVMTYEFSFL